MLCSNTSLESSGKWFRRTMVEIILTASNFHTFIQDLYLPTISASDYTWPKNMTINDKQLKRMLQELVVACFRVLSWRYVTRHSDKNHEKPSVNIAIIRSRFKTFGLNQKQACKTTHWSQIINITILWEFTFLYDLHLCTFIRLFGLSVSNSYDMAEIRVKFRNLAWNGIQVCQD